MAATYELIEILGKQNLIKLQAALGPAEYYLPTKAQIGHPICNAIGKIGMTQLCREFGGGRIWIGNSYANLNRNAEILQLRMAGMTPENVAESFGISARHVRNITQGEDATSMGPRVRRRVRQLAQGLEVSSNERNRREVGRNGAPNRKARRMASAN